jgi:hypothetical protein
MPDTNGFAHEIRKDPCYRVWVDDTGKGHLRIVRRINLKTLISLCRELYINIKKIDGESSVIVIYMPRSLHNEMSDNVHEFLQFCKSCTDTSFELNVIK